MSEVVKANLPGLARLTTSEVCDLARLSRATLWRRVASGKMPKPIDHGRQALFCLEEVTRALAGSVGDNRQQDSDAISQRFERLRNRPKRKA